MKELKQFIGGIILFLAIGAMIIIAWNLVCLILLRWFGFKCYRISIESCTIAIIAYTVIAMPFCCAVAKCPGDGGAALLGGIITGLLGLFALVLLFGDAQEEQYYHW